MDDCMHRPTYKNTPQVVFGGIPFDDIRPTLMSKSAFSQLMDFPDSAHPKTYRISQSVADCKAFFNKPEQTVRRAVAGQRAAFRKPQWIVKPVIGEGGKGIFVVSDRDEFQAKLWKPYGACNRTSSNTPIIVQKFIIPYLLQKSSFHIRTFVLMKFGKTGDPVQAWHIKMGNVHMCSEHFDKWSDSDLSSFATKCNLKVAKRHAAFGSPGHTTKDLVKRFPMFLKRRMPSRVYRKLISGINKALGGLAKAISNVSKTVSKGVEANWVALGVDFIVDSNVKPWLLEVNTCPGAGDLDPNDKHARNPYDSMLRVMLTHYRRKMLNEEDYSEQACADDPGLSNVIERVL